MPVTPTTKSFITGGVPLPSGSVPAGGEVVFTLNAADIEGENVILPGSERAVLTPAGELPADFELWRNTEGLRGTSYIVTAFWRESLRDGRVDRSTTLGQIQVGDDAAYALADLLNLDALPPIGQTTLAQMREIVGEVTDIADEFFTVEGAVEAALDAAGLSVEAAELSDDAREAAQVAASQSAASAPWNYPTIADMLADTTAWPDGTELQVRGGSLFAAKSDAVSPDRVTAGLIKLAVVPDPVEAAMVARSYDLHTSNSGSVNHAAIQLAIDNMLVRGGAAVRVHPGNFVVSGKVNVWSEHALKGPGWRSTVLHFDTSDGGVTIGSSSIVEDLDLRGTKTAQFGLQERGSFNRCSLRRVRIQDFTEWGYGSGMVGQANNSLVEDMQVKFCGINYALAESLNLQFFNCNGDQREAGAEGGTSSQRNIKFFPVDPYVNPNDQIRNTKFYGGIFERGIGDYQLEGGRSFGAIFYGTEFNGGVIAPIYLPANSDIQFYSPHFTTLTGQYAMLSVDGGRGRVYGKPTLSGLTGKSEAECFAGNISFDNDPSGFPWYTASAIGPGDVRATSGDVAVGGTRGALTISSATGGGSGNRADFGLTTGMTSAVTGHRVYSGEVFVTEMTGAPELHLVHPVSPFRTKLMDLQLGINRFSLATDVRSQGRLSVLDGGGAWSTTLAAASLRVTIR